MRKAVCFVAILCAGVVRLSWSVEPQFYIGWAQEAHPDYTGEIFLSHLAEQKKYGANLVWVGHNNPGIVDKNKFEPGLSYAVYEALRDEKSSLHADAVEQAAAVKRLLEAARHEGFQAVLAVGYQIQMGPVWNEHHPDALRREHDGHLFNAGGNSASWLSPDYQRDIQEYYRWVDREWVMPYKDVIIMLNLADEPHGGDYSQAAEAAFKAETGLTWKEAGQTEEGVLKKGHFQNLYIANYASWSAEAWKTIDPAIRVTMSFCGSHGRFINFEPSVAAIFKGTPDNFDITFDAFLIDNQPGDPIDGKHVSALAIFLSQVGDLSRKYNKRVWLWPIANNWGLSQWSAVKGNISDALFGVTFLRNISAGAGIHLGGLAMWNLDIQEQGLFRDTHPLSYDPQRMFEKISGDFKTKSTPVLFRKDLLVWIPESEADHLIGRKEYDYADRVYLLDVYAPLLERGIIPMLSSDNELPSPHPSPSGGRGRSEAAGEGYRFIFLISKYPPYLLDSAYKQLDAWVRDGGTLVCNYPVIQPDSLFERLKLQARFYGTTLWAAVTHQPKSFVIDWGQGKILLLCETMNEKRRNIIHEIPPEVVHTLDEGSELPVDAGVARGLLSFPLANGWMFYNTNPNPNTVLLKQKMAATLVAPDGTLTPVSAGGSPLVMPHGAYLELTR